MHVSIKHGDYILPLSIPAVLRMPDGVAEINPATAGMFLIVRAIATAQSSLHVLALPHFLLEALREAAASVPGQSRITMTGPIEQLTATRPGAPVLEIAAEDDDFIANDTTVSWPTAQRWANSALMTIPKIGLGCTMPWQFKMSLVVMRLASHLAARATLRGLDWFEEACGLTRDLLRAERPDPNHYFDILTPEGAMAAGLCWIDPFARQQVIADIYPSYETAAGFFQPMMDYADCIGQLNLEDLASVRLLADEINADGAVSPELSGHQSLALAGYVSKLSIRIRTILDLVELPSGIG